MVTYIFLHVKDKATDKLKYNIGSFVINQCKHSILMTMFRVFVKCLLKRLLPGTIRDFLLRVNFRVTDIQDWTQSYGFSSLRRYKHASRHWNQLRSNFLYCHILFCVNLMQLNLCAEFIKRISFVLVLKNKHVLFFCLGWCFSIVLLSYYYVIDDCILMDLHISLVYLLVHT